MKPQQHRAGSIFTVWRASRKTCPLQREQLERNASDYVLCPPRHPVAHRWWRRGGSREGEWGVGIHLAGASDLGIWSFFKWVDTYSHRETVKGLQWKPVKYTIFIFKYVIFKYSHLKEQDFFFNYDFAFLYFFINHKLKEGGQTCLLSTLEMI